MTLGAFFSELGLSVSEPVLDGQVHRVDPTDKPGGGSGWYVGWEAPYTIIVAGDWRKPGCKATYLGHKNAKLSREDQARVKRLIDEARKQSEWERAERARKAAVEAEALIARAELGTHPYLTRKKIDKLQCLVLTPHILIPLVDRTHKVKGLQQIPVLGKKLFLTGQKSGGLAHYISGDPNQVLICEGFATGATLSLATGYTVYCAMSAGNLVKVADWVRKKHHSSAITICGDDDQFTEQGNAGRRYAMEAAELAQASVVFPRFSSLEDQPTDFNDLHCREGLATVGDQVRDPEGRSRLIVPLGKVGLKVYMYDSESHALVEFSQFTNTEFLHLAPLEYWKTRHPAPTSQDGVDWTQAKDDIIQTAKRVGIFDSSRVRGTGVWRIT